MLERKPVCNITVIKRNVNKELIDEYVKIPEHFKLCDKVKDGQEFLVNNPFDMPEGICVFVWADPRPFLMTIAAEGTFRFCKIPNTTVASCSDLFRPVFFKIEKIL